MKAKSALDQRISSSERRDRCIIRMRGEAAELDGEIAVGDGVQAVAGDAGKTELLGDPFAIDGEGGACQRAGTERQDS